MNRFFVCIASICTFLSLGAQETKEQKMEEVTITAQHVTEEIDGKLIIPQREVQESAQNAYDLLAQLALNGIKVDEPGRSITSSAMLGGVQVRINGIVAGEEDMLMLDPKLVKNVHFITRPGLRYGNDLAFVIDIRTRRADTGWATGVDLQNSVTQARGSDIVYMKRNAGNSEWTLNLNNYYVCDFNARTYYQRSYLLNDGTTHNVSHRDLSTRNRTFGQSLDAKWNWADSTRTVVQVDFNLNHSNTPDNRSLYELTDQSTQLFNTRSSHRSLSPTLNLYVSRHLRPRHTLQANATLSTINSDVHSEMNEGGTYSYNVDGHTRALWSELVHEAKLKPFTVSSGVQFDWRYMNNRYTGSVADINGIHQTRFYLFSELKGSLQQLYYQLGVGANLYRSSQGVHLVKRLTWRPKLTLSYPIGEMGSMWYSAEYSQPMSQVAMTSDTRIRQNSREWNVGNPNIRPSNRVEQSLGLALSGKRWQNTLTLLGRLNNHTNMAHYERTDDNQFLYYQLNQGHINMMYATNHTQFDLIPKKLRLSMTHGVYRFWNFSPDYTHTLTSYQVSGSIQAYLGRWTLSYMADNGFRWVEGESKGRNMPSGTFVAGYRWKNCNLRLFAEHPFQAHVCTHRSWLLNKYMHGEYSNYNKSLGNRITLSFTWQLLQGRRYRDIQRRKTRGDQQTGIMK